MMTKFKDLDRDYFRALFGGRDADYMPREGHLMRQNSSHEALAPRRQASNAGEEDCTPRGSYTGVPMETEML